LIKTERKSWVLRKHNLVACDGDLEPFIGSTEIHQVGGFCF